MLLRRCRVTVPPAVRAVHARVLTPGDAKRYTEPAMDLFVAAGNDPRDQPLAARMRPRSMDEFIGQEHIVGPGRLLRRAIQADQLSSVIFYGPPGTGKTTLAIVIANHTKSHFITVNAVLAGVAAIREAIESAQQRKQLYGQRTILFVDEVHRWNKAQQDALLPWVENGTIILVGATTENPYFEVNRALVSRSRIFQLLPLTEGHLREVAMSALRDPERGYGKLAVSIDNDALDHLVKVSSGDARTILNALELAVETTPSRFPPEPGEEIHISRPIAEESIQQRAVLYDKEGDYHFDTISAFIKSLRGSDPDAAVYWLAKMVYAGEDPRFLFRRMIIFAAEDVGLADPHALVVAESNAAAFDRVGLPEGRFHLANTALYLATAPKSNSVFAFFDALKIVESERDSDVPVHLRDASRDAQGFGHGEGYQYPHAFRGHWVAQQYLPASLQGRVFYQPTRVGHEASIHDTVIERREAQLAAMLQSEELPAEILTVSPVSSSQDRWAERAMSGQSEEVRLVRERLLEGLELRRHGLVLVLNAATGFLVWEALRRVPEGGVWAQVEDGASSAILERPPFETEEIMRPVVLAGPLAKLSSLLRSRGDGELRFELIVGWNALTRVGARGAALELLRDLLRSGGRLRLAETVPSECQRLSELLKEAYPAAARTMENAEGEVYRASGNPLLGFGSADLSTWAASAGLSVEGCDPVDVYLERRIGTPDIERWLAPGSRFARALENTSGGALEETRAALVSVTAGITTRWRRRVALLRARRG